MRRGLSFVVSVLLLAAAPTIAFTTTGCDGVLGPSKVAHGERYTPGDPRYDAFFEAVHQEQIAAGTWRDERTNARKTIIILAGVTSTASDEVLVRSMRDRAKGLGGEGARLDLARAKVIASPGAKEDTQLFAAVGETMRRELDRARKLAAASEKLDQLKTQGEALQKEAAEDQKNAGVDKADEKKMERHREIRRELGAAVDALEDLSRDAKRHVRDAESFLDGLDAALQGKERVARPEGRVFPPPAAATPEDTSEPLPRKEQARGKVKGGGSAGAGGASGGGAGGAGGASTARKPSGGGAPPEVKAAPVPARAPAPAPAAKKPEGEVFNP